MELYDGGKVIECATLFEEFRQTAKSLVTIFQTTRDLFPANISNEELQNVTGGFSFY